jgi:hypothetical protein
MHIFHTDVTTNELIAGFAKNFSEQ